VQVPSAALLQLPEKVVQFGTGVLLRGLPDYCIDQANKQGRFNGRVVMVKSTNSGDTSAYQAQQCLYTHCIKGIQNGQAVASFHINASISRVLAANTQWQQVLHCAADPAIEIAVSNTTEAGLVLQPSDRITDTPPASFPGKLLAFLHHRFTVFNGAADKGLVILPTELLANNGNVLKQLVLNLAEANQLSTAFVQWLQNANHFCNTLVDRIVPGKLSVAEQAATESMLGYSDALMIMSEPYGLWAIEAKTPALAAQLGFADGLHCVVCPDIEQHRILKISLLNAVHTFCCGTALQAGFDTVKQAMGHAGFAAEIQALMETDIIPAITSETVNKGTAQHFAKSVLDRFRNPFIEHHWHNIALNFTQKVQVRCIPLIKAFYAKTGRAPLHMATGFASYLLHQQCQMAADGSYYTQALGRIVALQDSHAPYFYTLWQQRNDITALVGTVLGNQTLWGEDLTLLPGFATAVTAALQKALQKTAAAAVAAPQQ
jgi:tagaturonate reductase